MTDYLADKYPALAGSLGKLPLADLPTPVAQYRFELDGHAHGISVKHDDRTSSFYGGNKLPNSNISCIVRDRDTRTASRHTAPLHPITCSQRPCTPAGWECRASA